MNEPKIPPPPEDEDNKNRPKVITICGSSRYCQEMAVVAWLLEKREKAITMGLHLLPYWYSITPIPNHLAEHEGVAKALDELHLKKIDMSDQIFVVNKNNYMGQSTQNEIAYARSIGLQDKIRYYTDDPIGVEVEIIRATYFKNKHICEGCGEWTPGIQCNAGRNYKDCEKEQNKS